MIEPSGENIVRVKPLVMFVLAVLLIGCGMDDDSPPMEDAPPGQVEVDEDSPVHEKLAVIDEGGPYVDEVTANRYSALLDRLSDTCREGRERIADMAVRSVDLLEEEGVESTALEQLEAARESVRDVGRTPCADIFASLVLLQTD